MRIPTILEGDSASDSAFKAHPLLKQSHMSSSQDAIALIPHVSVTAPMTRLREISGAQQSSSTSSASSSSAHATATPLTVTTSTTAAGGSVTAASSAGAPPLGSTSESSLNSTGATTPQPMSASQIQELIQQAIGHHEKDNLREAFRLYCLAAQQSSAIGLFLAGLSLRHGWGCAEDKVLAFACLEHAAEGAMRNIEVLRRLAHRQSGVTTANSPTNLARKRISKMSSASGGGPDAGSSGTLPRMIKAAIGSGMGTASSRVSRSSAEAAQPDDADDSSSLAPMDSLAFQDRMQAQISKFELAMSIYEIGQCYRFGWGVRKSKPTAVFYYRLAADLGDMDAQSDLASCYLNGKGVKANRYLAASYFRLAALQGRREYGDTWIYKEKYTVFFRKNFRTFAILEDKKNGTPVTLSRSMSNLEGEGSANSRHSLNILISIQTFMNNAMQERE